MDCNIPRVGPLLERKILKLELCGDLNRKGPHKLKYLNTWSIGSNTVMVCDLVGVAVALLEKLCY